MGERECVTWDGGREVRIQLGQREVQGRLPLILDRGRLVTARRRATGWTEEDDQRLAHAAKMLQEDFRREVAKGPSGELCVDSYNAVAVAAVGMCWPWGAASPVPSLRALKYDVVAYGEEVADHLVVELGYRIVDLERAGHELLDVIDESLPMHEEVEEAKDFSAGGTDESTDCTSGSA